MMFPPDSPYRLLSNALDGLPNRFPPAADESDLRLLAYLFTPEEASLAAALRAEPETPAEFAARAGLDARTVSPLLKEMARKGLIAFGKTAAGRPGFGLLPFVVGIYENQGERIDAEMARLFEDYFHQAFAGVLSAKPAVHRVVPVGEAIRKDLTVQPFESASALIDQMASWGVVDCICRKQKALIGQACQHPLDVCMVLSDRAGAFTPGGPVRPLSREEAHAVLRRAASLGLVHSVSNNQRDLWYLCNCCTCSCGILRGMAELGIAGVVAGSAFVAEVDAERCAGCGDCSAVCSFHAIDVDLTAAVNSLRCAGCGVCVPECPLQAITLVRRPGYEPPPADEKAWGAARQAGS
jgi:ferredoxin